MLRLLPATGTARHTDATVVRTAFAANAASAKRSMGAGFKHERPIAAPNSFNPSEHFVALVRCAVAIKWPTPLVLA